MSFLKTRRLSWFGHDSRIGQERLCKALLEWIPENEKRKRGRCRTRWRDTVERDARLAGMDQDLESMAADSHSKCCLGEDFKRNVRRKTSSIILIVKLHTITAS